MTQSAFLQIFEARGFLHQCTNFEALDVLLKEAEQTSTPFPIYIGFDCTAPSLHVGSLIQIMILYHVQQCGHKPIVLLGGGTTKVGDPSGKDASRQMLDEIAIQRNKDGIKRVFEKFITFESEFNSSTSHAFIVDNDDWLSELHYIDFLRDVGKHFSVNRMLTMESVKQRLERESHLSFLEFNYMILQAYDFVELNKRYQCRLQIGGSDQWGNIVMGTEFNRRAYADAQNIEQEKDIFGLTTPLLTTASGTKMGKTAEGAIWLNEELLSAYDYWQFWRNTDDADVARFLKLFTNLSLDKIKKLSSLEGAQINEAKKILATEATKLLHGTEKATAAEETARKTFEEGQAAESLPTITLSLTDTGNEVATFKLFQLAELVTSGKEARRLIQGGGARINNEKVENENHPIILQEYVNGTMKLSAGKKKHILLKIIE